VARAEPGFEAIGAYVAQLEPDLFGRRRMRRRIATEVRAHLEEAAAREIERGLPPTDAQKRAIERFGPPRTVINSWAESKGIGVVITFTRYGGLAGIIGALGLTASFVWAAISWSFSIRAFAEVALVFGALLVAGMVALYTRLRGKLGRYARVGFRLIITGLVVGFGSSMLWFVPGGVAAIAMLIVGAAFYLLGALRADVGPRQPLLLWAAGLVASVVIGLGGTVTGTETEYVAAGLGYGLFNAGWIWLGLHLWHEQPSTEEHTRPQWPSSSSRRARRVGHDRRSRVQSVAIRNRGDGRVVGSDHAR
jgi:hypothetical protein